MKLLALFSLLALACSQCPDGWELFSNKCYYFDDAFQQGNTYWIGEYWCHVADSRADLAIIENSFENSFVKSRLNTALKYYWIGIYGHDISWWSFLNNFWGSHVSYTNWAPGEPKANNQQVAIDSKTGYWITLPYMSTVTVPSVCTMPVPSPLTTCPPPPQPKVPCDNGWTFNSQTAACYKAKTSLTFVKADADCKSQGGHLTSIHSQSENEFVFELVTGGVRTPTSEDQTWIGLLKSNGNWTWTDGTPMDFTNWVMNSQQEFSYCGMMVTDYYNNCTSCFESQWQQQDCQKTMRAYVCKKTAYN